LKNASSAAEKAQMNANEARTLASRSSTESIINSANAILSVSRALEDTVLDAENRDEYAVKINKQLEEKLERLKAIDLKGTENITRIKEAQNVLEDHNDRLVVGFSL
jgi:DNA uptake protein ComE-like DNA-binding protein